jgi:hypothetical protein
MRASSVLFQDNGRNIAHFVFSRRNNGRPYAGGNTPPPKHIDNITLYSGGFIRKVFKPEHYRQGSLYSIYKQFAEAYNESEQTRADFTFTFDWTPAPTGGRRKRTRRSKKKGTRKVKK